MNRFVDYADSVNTLTKEFGAEFDSGDYFTFFEVCQDKTNNFLGMSNKEILSKVVEDYRVLGDTNEQRSNNMWESM